MDSISGFIRGLPEICNSRDECDEQTTSIPLPRVKYVLRDSEFQVTTKLAAKQLAREQM